MAGENAEIDWISRRRHVPLLNCLQLFPFPLNPSLLSIPAIQLQYIPRDFKMSLSHIFRPALRSPRIYNRRTPSYTLSPSCPSRRTYASQTPGNPVMEIFNRKTKHLQKDRAARNVEESRKTDYIKDEVAMRLCERLLVYLPPKPTTPNR